MKFTTLAVSVLALGSVASTLAQQNEESTGTGPTGLIEDVLVPLSSNDLSNDTSINGESSPFQVLVDPTPAAGTQAKGNGADAPKASPKESSIMNQPLDEKCVKIIRDQFNLQKVRTCFGLAHGSDKFSEDSFIDMYIAASRNTKDLSAMESYVINFGDQYCSTASKCDEKELQTLRDAVEDTVCKDLVATNGWLGFVHQYTMTYPLLQKSFCIEGPLNVFNTSRTVGRCGAWTARKILTASLRGGKDIQSAVPSVANLMELFIAAESSKDIKDFGVCDVCIPIYGRQANKYKLAAHKKKQFADLSTTFLGDSDKLEALYHKVCPDVVVAHIQGYGAAPMTLSQLGKTGLALTSLVMATLAWL